MVVLALLALLATTPPGVCRVDADCVVSSFAGCCPACCRARPHAVLRGTDEQNACGVRTCEAVDCRAVSCPELPPDDAFTAVCRAGQCIATFQPVCRTDADCAVVDVSPPADAACHRTPCGCCPVNAAVVASTFLFDDDAPDPAAARPVPSPAPSPAQSPAPARRRKGPQRSVAPAPPPAREAVACAPCPRPPPATATCVQRRCILRPP
jgi:hypothetical protein